MKGGRDDYRHTTRYGREGIKSVSISLTNTKENVHLQLWHQDGVGVFLPLGQDNMASYAVIGESVSEFERWIEGENRKLTFRFQE